MYPLRKLQGGPFWAQMGWAWGAFAGRHGAKAAAVPRERSATAHGQLFVSICKPGGARLFVKGMAGDCRAHATASAETREHEDEDCELPRQIKASH